MPELTRITPLDWQTQIVDAETGRPTEQFIRLWQQLFQNGEVQSGVEIIAGDGLEGGGDLSEDVTLSLEPSGVTPGSYTNTNLTVDEFGRITVAANGSGGGGGGSTPTIRGSNIQSSNNSSYTVTWPTGTLQDDVVFIFVGHGFGVDSIPTGWVQLGKLSGGNFNGSVLAKVMTSADITAGSVTVNISGGYYGVLGCVSLVGSTVTNLTTSGFFARDGVGVTSYIAPVLAAAGSNLVLLFVANRGASTNTADKGTLLQTVNATEASGAVYEDDAAAFGFSTELSLTTAGSGYYVAVLSVGGP